MLNLNKGLDSLESSNEIDIKLFVLSYLLSTQLIYNTQSLIKESSLMIFTFMANITKYLKLSTTDKRCSSMIWVLRDVFLQQRNQSDQDYFDQQISKANRATGNYANVDLVKNIFKTIIPVCLPFPVSDSATQSMEDLIELIPQLTNDQLRPEFDNKMNETDQAKLTYFLWLVFFG